MSRATRLSVARKLNAISLTSTCIVERLGAPTLDDSTGLYTPARSTIYEGPCEIQFRDTASREATPQGQSLLEQSPVLKLPVDGTGEIRPGDVGRLTANPHDPAVVGLEFRVNGLHARTWATTRRIPIEVVT